MALGISRHIFLYVKQMAICYTSRSRYGKRQRSPSEKRSTEHENTHSQYRTVNYCFFATLFSGFLHNKTQYSYWTESVRQWPTISLTFFSRHFPKWKEKLRVHVEHNTVTSYCLLVWFFFGSNSLTHNFLFFCQFVFLITTLQRKAVTKYTQEVASAKEERKIPLGVCTLLYMIISPATSFQTLWAWWVKKKNIIFTSVFFLPLYTPTIHPSAAGRLRRQ